MHKSYTLWLRGATLSTTLFALHACTGEDLLIDTTYQPKKSTIAKAQAPPPDGTIIPIPYKGNAWGEQPMDGLLLGGSPDDEDSDGEDKKVYSAAQHQPDVKHNAATSSLGQGSTTASSDPLWHARLLTARQASVLKITPEHNKPLVATANKITTTQALIKALNHPKRKDKLALRRIFKEYNILFQEQSFAQCDDKDIHYYSLLAKVQPNDEATQKLLETYVEVWRQKTEEGFDFKKYARGIEAFLQHIAPQAFKGDPTLLTKLGLSLLKGLPEDKGQYTQSTYPSYKNTLNALHHALIKIRLISPDKWSPKEPLYSRFKAKLALIEKSKYYPFAYQARLLQQSLVLLKAKPEPSHPAWRVYYGAKGVLQVVQSIMGAVILDFDFEDFEEGLSNLAGAIVGDTDNPDGNIQDAAKLL
ncbi:MAG: hypothetical protein AAFP93_02255, partial [Bacteroidota bacterium]